MLMSKHLSTLQKNNMYNQTTIPILITKADTASTQHRLSDRGPRYAGTPRQQHSAPKAWHGREGCWISTMAPTPATQPSVYLYPPPTRSGTSDLLVLPHVPFPSASNTQAIFSHDHVWQGCPWRETGGDEFPSCTFPQLDDGGWWGPRRNEAQLSLLSSWCGPLDGIRKCKQAPSSLSRGDRARRKDTLTLTQTESHLFVFRRP